MGQADRRRNEFRACPYGVGRGVSRFNRRPNKARDKPATQGKPVATLDSRVFGVMPWKLGTVGAGLPGIAARITQTEGQQNHRGAKHGKNKGGNGKEIAKKIARAYQGGHSAPLAMPLHRATNGNGAKALKLKTQITGVNHGNSHPRGQSGPHSTIDNRQRKGPGIFSALDKFTLQAIRYVSAVRGIIQ